MFPESGIMARVSLRYDSGFLFIFIGQGRISNPHL